MNKDRRERLDEAIELLDRANFILSECGAEESEYADNMPENMHGSEKHDRAEEVSTDLGSAADECEQIADTVSGLMGN